MSHCLRSLIAGLALLAAAWPAAAAGIRFEVEFSEAGAEETQERMIIWLSDRRLRIEQQRPAPRKGEHVIIYRGDQDVFLSLDPSNKRYLQVGRELIAALGFEMQAARREVDGRLGRLPDDQHAIIERYLGARETGKPLAVAPLQIVPNERREKLGSHQCRGRDLVRGEVVVGDVCVVDWQAVGIGPEDLRVFRELANFQRGLMGARELTPLEMVPDQPLDLLVQFDGFPLHFRNLGPDGVQSEIRVVSAEPIAAADPLFEVPEGYQLLSGFEFLAGTAATPARPAD